MNRLFAALVASLTLIVPAHAGALAHACMSPPSAMSKQKCLCLEHGLRKVLSADEMRIAILTFKGKYAEFRKKTKAMGTEDAASFVKRMRSVTKGTLCNR